MLRFIRKFIYQEKGATAIEYALIAGLIAVICITALTSVGSKARDSFSTIANSMRTAAT